MIRAEGTAGTPLHLLVVEDSADDTELVARQLRREGYAVSWRRVDSEDSMRAALRREKWDLIISDYTMPGFGGVGALRVVQELRLDVPFILVSGTIGDEQAVAAMRAGAHDYVLKQNLARLGSAVARELCEAAVRRERRRAAAGLRFLAEASATLSASLDYDLTLRRVARLAVTFLADFCAVHVVEGREEARWVAAAHIDPAREGPLCQLCVDHPLIWGSPDPIASALRAGEPRILSAPSDGAAPRDGGSALLAHAWAAGARTAMIVPVVARGRTLGVSSYFSRGDDHDYGPVDLDLAEDLARRVAVSLDNARLYREARDAVRARDAFLLTAAHELKTPLSRLCLQLRLARGDVERALADEGRQRAARRFDLVDRHIDTLTGLVDHLLDVARSDVSEAPLTLAEVDLGVVAARVIDRMAHEVERAGCVIQVSRAGEVLGMWDPARLDDIVASLISNALKYGARTPIEVRVSGDEHLARLSVEDRGIGIAAEDQGRIFERFERAVSVRHYSGFGLGLWIAWDAANALGGTIRVSSAPGAGATFTLELPRAGPAGGGGS